MRSPPAPVSPSAGASWRACIVFLAVGLLAAPATFRLHTRMSRPLLSAPRRIQLARRVERLTDTRTRALDAQAAELRRIERDLHEGAQA
ncbi:hypothetical protein [Streptomyces platensis]|uniref:hypothetical protein n=1 Tax=Streptomyces platensis TaxID=58346 RepID=UPI002E81BA65|nr:hypothetical protein [Streptomyces platensis]